MKKFLLSLTLLMAAFFGHSQIVLNELYTEKSTYTGNARNINVQYFELYNIGNEAVNLNCYSIITQYTVTTGSGSNAITKKGYYVIDLPDVTLQPKEYYVGAAAGSETVNTTSGSVSYKPNFNWNSGTSALSAIGASFKNYEFDGSGYKAAVDIVPNTDFFTPQATGDIKHNVFLFNGSEYVNGFVSYGSAGTPIVPSIFNNQTSLPITTSCGNVVIDWKNEVTQTEFVGAATGTGHGYFRGRNGLCGTWDKITLSTNAPATPTTQNPIGKITSASGVISSIERLECDNSKISYVITGYPDELYPVTVELYYDNGDGIFTEAELKATKSDITASTLSGSFNLLEMPIPAGVTPVLVYRTPLGCIGKIGTVTQASNTLVSNQRNICGSRVDFEVTSISKDLDSLGTPIKVELFADINKNGLLDDGQTALAFTSISAASGTTYKLDIPVENKNDSMLLVFSSSEVCFHQVVKAPTILGEAQTSATSFCGKRVDFTLSNKTLSHPSYAFPYTVEIHYDVNNDGEVDMTNPNEANVIGSKFPIEFGTYSINLPAGTPENLLIVYKPAQSCLRTITQKITVNNTPVEDIVLGGLLPEGSTTVTYSLRSAPESAYPITLYVYEDFNGDGAVNGPDNIIATKEAPIPGVDYGATITNVNSYALVIAESLGGCSFGELSIESSESALPVTYASFLATRTSNSQVLLEWETAMEENNKGFQVQRNVDGTWRNIGFVFTQAERGNSTSSLKYTYKDANSHKGISQYRILQVDIDGRGKFSEVRSVRGEEMAARLTVFPNPSTSGSFNLLFEDAASLRDVIISDVSGRVVKQYKGVGNGSLTVDNLGAGFYTLQVLNRTTGAMATEKVIIKKR